MVESPPTALEIFQNDSGPPGRPVDEDPPVSARLAMEVAS